MRILVTGSRGMLGANLVNSLRKSFDVYATDYADPNNNKLNYLDFNLENEKYDDLIEWANPEIVIHCAAITDGNYCEENPYKSFNVNGYSLKKFIDSTNSNVKIIYISTDAVFSSATSYPDEKHLTKPENIYGKSKELGEFFLVNSQRDYIILRTTIVGKNINPARKGFVEWIINSVIKKQKITLFSDVLFNPISIWHFINEIEFLIASGKFYKNIFHVCGIEKTTKYDFGIKLISEINLNKDYIIKSKITEFKYRAKRSTDQTMDCSKYINLTKRILPKISETVKSIKLNYNV